MKTNNDWPPKNGRAFVRSDEFGRMLISEVERLAHLRRDLDFVDAVATAYEWFTRRLNRNGHFINKRRFPTEARFRAYLRQALFNAARMARRKRDKGEELSAVPADHQIVDGSELSLEERDKLLQLVDQLEEPSKSIFEGVFFGENELHLVAGALGLNEDEGSRIYEEALDELEKLARNSGND